MANMNTDEPIYKKQKLQKVQELTKEDEVLSNFLEWMRDENFRISPKVMITKNGACSRYGLLAKENISKGVFLFSVPRTALLWERNCTISTELEHVEQPSNGSGWIKLILCLMYEYTHKSSRWNAYMQFVPSVSCMDLPMYWDLQQRTCWLKGTTIDVAVDKDIASIEKEYHEIALPFIKKHSQLGFNKDTHTLALYKHMVAFVMAYSFTEPHAEDKAQPAPVMVPMADVLNHVAFSNAKLMFEDDCLTMITTKDIASGCEIYNTYGELTNCQLLHMYGFVEEFPNNIYDAIEINLSTFFDVAEKETSELWPCLNEKRTWLSDNNNLEDTYPILFGMKGVLSCSEFKLLFKVLAMSEEEFHCYKENDDWESDCSESDDENDECDFEVYNYQKIKQNMSTLQRNFLHNVASSCLRCYNHDLISDSATLFISEQTDSVKSRLARSRNLVFGHVQILQLLLSVNK